MGCGQEPGTVFAMGLASYFVFLKTYLLDEPALGTMGLFYAVYVLAAVFLRVAFGWVPERFGLVRVLIPALGLAAVGVVLLAVARSPIHLACAALVLGTSHAFAFPILSALVVTRAQPDERGSAIALFTALFDLGVLFGGPSFGASVKYGGYRVSFALAAVVLVVATAIYVVWDRRVEVPDHGE